MTKPITLLFFLLVLCVPNASAQVKDASASEPNLYAKALSACLVKQSEEYGKLGLSGINYNNRIVEYDVFLTNKLPTQFGNIKVQYLEANTLRERYNKSRKRIPILSLRPIINEGALLRINVLDYWFSHSKKSYVYELEGGCNVEFRFDSSQDNFALTKIHLWGV